MLTVVLVIHLLLTVALVGLVLLQKSEGGGLATGGGASGGANFLSGRAAGNILTKATVVLAVCFMATSILLAIMASMRSRGEDDLLKALMRPQSPPPIEAPAEPKSEPAGPDALPPAPPSAAPAPQESAPPKP
ncbi:Preprotein translocase subunit SecG [uncultured Alphaproteobacteria bacterium]|jgi:preprotein translocase subunit SecG|uniref:Protein-export membrane protein SecG n=1 Tax=uncultured Alphaproteobacteria bacterium TaxID=91750 RepID=A0A212J7R0_9PROT|nr:Preprotein translocase subunit SecG [uncultured Alphaproteobacteria bacterium]